MIGWVITFLILAGIAITGGIGWSKLKKEHQEAKSLPIQSLDFNELQDGVFHGAYQGGMFKWRANECQLTVKSGRVTDIQLIGSQDPGTKNTQHQMLYDRIMDAQSLQVDTISGATLTSKAYLKAVEDALVHSLGK